jgi:hypothetical protein
VTAARLLAFRLWVVGLASLVGIVLGAQVGMALGVLVFGVALTSGAFVERWYL